MSEILYCQSPALFLASAALFILFFVRRKNHAVRAALALILAILSLIGGLALYYFGMYYESFTIHNFWHIRFSGWVGLLITAGIIVLLVYRSICAYLRRRKAARNAEKAQQEHSRQLEDAKTAAYASGRADAMAEGKVAETVSEAVDAKAPKEDA